MGRGYHGACMHQNRMLSMNVSKSARYDKKSYTQRTGYPLTAEQMELLRALNHDNMSCGEGLITIEKFYKMLAKFGY